MCRTAHTMKVILLIEFFRIIIIILVAQIGVVQLFSSRPPPLESSNQRRPAGAADLVEQHRKQQPIIVVGTRRQAAGSMFALTPTIRLDAPTVAIAQFETTTPGGGNSSPTTANSTAAAATESTAATTTTTSTTTTEDPNSDHEDSILAPNSPDSQNSTNNNNDGKDSPNKGDNSDGANKNLNNKANSTGAAGQHSERQSIELNVLWYSIFMVYVSFVKLIYHNVALIKRNLTEPAILMLFGMLWEIISRQIYTSLDVNPRFNSRIFFYLFLPSTVLESAAVLSNKWLLLNILPILIHSIVGTLLYGSAIAFTIYSMSRQDLFNIGISPIQASAPITIAATLFDHHRQQQHQHDQHQQQQQQQQPSAAANQSAAISFIEQWPSEEGPTSTSTTNLAAGQQQREQQQQQQQQQEELRDRGWQRQLASADDQGEESTFLYEKSYVVDPASMLGKSNLSIADCLVLGSILSSLDSTTMLGAFSMFQVNEKLYYLVLGESLMNQAVVLIVFNLLLDFLNTTRLTVVKIYIAIIQFFITLLGSIFVGLILASVALLAVRLIKRFQVPGALTSYQNQCLAMIETLLILKLAYLAYTLGSWAGLSSIVSLATFGVLQDQYIRLNLNLRSQLTFRQVILATKTMGFSLVYPLLGMLLVDVAYASQHVARAGSAAGPAAAAAAASASLASSSDIQAGLVGAAAAAAATVGGQSSGGGGLLLGGAPAAVASAASKLGNPLANQPSSFYYYWNFKFLSLLTVIVIVYRFGTVILLSQFCNLISNRRVKVRFREQLLMAYGGLKGPLAVALVHRLIEHEEHRDRLMRNKHLFMYTILFITFLSVIVMGAFIRPLVEKLQVSLEHPRQLAASQRSILFHAINSKVLECTTQALRSLIGRSRSPYDRLFEFNESRIKPWLARDGSTNTNWLANLYDQLLLDETLDSNCFYMSTQEPIAGSFWRRPDSRIAPAAAAELSPTIRRQLGSIEGRRVVGSGSSSAGASSMKPLNIVEERDGFIDDDDLFLLRLGPAAAAAVPPVPPAQPAGSTARNSRHGRGEEPPSSRGSRREFDEQRRRSKRAAQGQPMGATATNGAANSNLASLPPSLRDFVMLDLAEVRDDHDHDHDDDQPPARPPAQVGGRTRVAPSGAGGHPKLIMSGLRPTIEMLSSTSCGDDTSPSRRERRNQPESSSDKDGYISALERHMDLRRRAAANQQQQQRRRRPPHRVEAGQFDDNEPASMERSAAAAAAAAAAAKVAKAAAQHGRANADDARLRLGRGEKARIKHKQRLAGAGPRAAQAENHRTHGLPPPPPPALSSED